MASVAYSSPFVPAEWIAAHGLRPRRVVPRSHNSAHVGAAAPGLCPYARAYVSNVVADTEAAGFVFVTTCDQMRRAPELVALQRKLPVFLLNVPSTWETAAAHRLYRDELRRLGRFLERLGGRRPSNEALTRVMLEYDAARAALRSAAPSLSARRYAEAIAALDAASRFPASGDGRQEGTPGVPLALVGGPLLDEDFALYDVIEHAGGRVVLDATEGGERTMPAPFDRRRVRDDPFGELADAYFGAIPDVSRRPNSEFFAWLKRELAARGVRGVILHRYLWCDLWDAETQRIKEWCAVPVLALSDGDGTADARARTTAHVAAFLEVVS